MRLVTRHPTGFRLLEGVPAAEGEGGSTVVFSPYNTMVVVWHPTGSGDIKDFTSVCGRLGCFGTPSLEGPSLPENFDLTLVVTSDCNLRCRYCFARGGDKQEYMDVETAIAVVDNVFRTTSRANIKVSFFGGEPTLHTALIRAVVRHVRELAPACGKEFSFYITTNGAVRVQTLSYLIDEGFTFVVSCDGPPWIQDHLRPATRGSSTSSRVARTVSELVRRKVPFKVRTTVTAFNVNALAETIRYFGEHGVGTVHLEAVTHAGRGSDADPSLQRAGLTSYVSAFSEALREAERAGVSVINSSYMNFLAPARRFCDAMAGSRLVASYSKDITLCVEVQDVCHPFAGQAIVGGVSGPLHEVELDQRKYNHVVHTSSDTPSPDCRRCFARFACGGGCPVKHFHAGGCRGVDAYRCAATQAILAEALARVFDATVAHGDKLFESSDVTVLRMQVPPELWMKRKTARISQVLGVLLLGESGSVREPITHRDACSLS